MDEKLQLRAEQLATEFANSATTIEDLNGLMRLMLKSGLERMLNSEMDVHLGRNGDAESPAAEEAKRSGNRRNGRSQKTVQGELGEVTLETPRDRNGTFEPQIVGKHQRRIPDFDEKILALYAKGMTTRDIQEIVQELYGVEVSPTLISSVTEDLDPPREAICPSSAMSLLGNVPIDSALHRQGQREGGRKTLLKRLRSAV